MASSGEFELRPISSPTPSEWSEAPLQPGRPERMATEPVPATPITDPFGPMPPVVASLSPTTSTASAASHTSPRPRRVGFTDPAIALNRSVCIRTFAIGAIVLTLLLWVLFALLFGSASAGSEFSRSARVLLVDLDNGTVGSALRASAGLIALGNPPSIQPLDVLVADWRQFPDPPAVQARIDAGDAWAALIALPNATQRLQTMAQSNVDGGVLAQPPETIMLTYDLGRGATTQLQLIIPVLQTVLQSIRARVARDMFLQYVNATAAVSFINAVTNPLGNVANVPMHMPAAIGGIASSVALIFLWLVPMFTLGVVDAAMLPLEKLVHVGPFLALRYAAASAVHLLQALSFVTLVVIFGGSFVSNFGTAWMFVFLAMSAFGYTGNLVLTSLPQPFALWLAVLLVVLNVAGAGFAYDLSLVPRFFWYGYGFPMLNAAQGLRTIFTGSYGPVGINVMVLLLWLAVAGSLLVVLQYRRIARGQPPPAMPPPPPPPRVLLPPVTADDGVLSPASVVLQPAALAPSAEAKEKMDAAAAGALSPAHAAAARSRVGPPEGPKAARTEPDELATLKKRAVAKEIELAESAGRVGGAADGAGGGSRDGGAGVGPSAHARDATL